MCLTLAALHPLGAFLPAELGGRGCAGHGVGTAAPLALMGWLGDDNSQPGVVRVLSRDFLELPSFLYFRTEHFPGRDSLRPAQAPQGGPRGGQGGTVGIWKEG